MPAVKGMSARHDTVCGPGLGLPCDSYDNGRLPSRGVLNGFAFQAVAAVVLSLLLAGPVLAQDHEHGSTASEKLGTVTFSTSCSAGAQPLFNRAVALLHSFEFAHAIEGFNATLKADPSCAMAAWGVALSRWSNPFSRQSSSTRAARAGTRRRESGPRRSAQRRRASGRISTRWRSCTPTSRRSISARASLAYRDAMAKVAAANPDDTEASIFYALAIAAAAPPTDKTYAELLKAGAILETIIASQPDHPGLSHYIIHSYDVPPLADRALEAARRYAKIAPSAPHALHMPSHTFTRVGSWQESIDTNIASGEAARRDGVDRRRAARDGLSDLRLPSDGTGRRRRARCSTRCPR